ncbi:MAG: lysophospholipid acyltransferase family protein [Holosporaceae bacterium]
MIRSMPFAALRLTALLLGLVVGYLIIFTVFLLSRAQGQAATRFVYRSLCRLAGLRLHYRGQPFDKAGLFVANHVSYFDILILGGFVRTAFISKTEVGRWPLIGSVAKKMNTFFVSRTQRALLKELKALSQRIVTAEHPFLLFAEGTSGDGVSLYAFKRALFQAVPLGEGAPVHVQPVSLYVSRLNGLKATTLAKKLYSWRGDIALVPHLWSLCRLGTFDIEILFHTPISTRTTHNRSELAQRLWHVMSQGEATLYQPDHKTALAAS